MEQPYLSAFQHTAALLCLLLIILYYMWRYRLSGRKLRTSENTTETCTTNNSCRAPICMFYFSALSITPALDLSHLPPYLTHTYFKQTRKANATSLAINCHTVPHPAFFFWLNMTFTIPHTLFYHFFNVYKENSSPKVQAESYLW